MMSFDSEKNNKYCLKIINIQITCVKKCSKGCCFQTGHYTFECPLMGRAKQAIQNEAQQAANATNQAQLAPQGPPPMVLQNPLPVQGLVATIPPPQVNPNTLGAPPMAETGVHHLLAMTTEEVKMQTRRNQYGTATKLVDTSVTSTSKIVNPPLKLPLFPCPPNTSGFQ